MNRKRNIAVTWVLLSLLAVGLAWLLFGSDLRQEDAALPSASEPEIVSIPPSQERPRVLAPTEQTTTTTDRGKPTLQTSRQAVQANSAFPALTTEEMVESLVLEMELGDGPEIPPRGQHTRFLQEDRDEIWAAPVEDQIQQELAEFQAKLGVDARIEVPRIECKATLCEVWGAELPGDQGTFEDWYRAMHSISSSEWARGEFVDVQTAMLSLPDGRVGWATFLVRAPDPGE